MSPTRSPRAFVFLLPIAILMAVAAAAAPPPSSAGGARLDRDGCLSAVPPAPDAERAVRPIPAAKAVDGAWRSVGPIGGDVEVVAVSPADAAVVLAGVAPSGGGGGGALYRSQDAGETWTQVVAFAGESVFDLAFTSAGAVFLAGYDGAAQSPDGGVTWSRLDFGIGAYEMATAIAVDPRDEDRVFAGAYDFAGHYSLQRSLDGGTTWQDVSTPTMRTRKCTAVAFSPADTAMVYACFATFDGAGGFFVSSDRGATWSDRTPALSPYGLNDVVHDGARILVTGGQLFGGQSVGLIASADDGLTWDALDDDSWPVRAHGDIAVAPGDPQTIFLASYGAGVYRSTDGGLTWEFGVGGTDELSVNAIAFTPGNTSRMYLGASSFAVLSSSDGGDSFGPSSKGITALSLFGIDANPLDLDELAVSFQSQNSGGVMTSVDGGLTWTLENCPPTRWNAVRFAPDGTLYALSDGPSTVAPEGVYRRDPGGSWKELGPDRGPAYETDLLAIEFVDADPEAVIIGGGDAGFSVGSEAGIWMSADRGATWTRTYEGTAAYESITSIAMSGTGADLRILAAFKDLYSDEGYTGGVLRSFDGGGTWAHTTVGSLYPICIPRICAAPARPGTFYVSDVVNGGVYRTPDSGSLWQRTAYVAAAAAVVADPLQAYVVYVAGVAAPLVSQSSNLGMAFSAFDGGLEGAGRPEVFAARGRSRTLLMLGTESGAYLREIIPAAVPAPVTADAALRCWPNPFNPEVSIAFELPRRGAVSLRIFDAAGRLVRTLIDAEVLPAGSGSATWDGRDDTGRAAPSGTYFCRVSAGDAAWSAKVVLLK